MKYTLHKEGGSYWVIDEKKKVAAHLRTGVTEKQAQAVVKALEDNHKAAPQRSKFLAAVQHGEVA